MITLFELQSQSGQLWLEIVAHLEAKDSAHAAEASSKDSAHAAEVASLNLAHQDAVDAKTAEIAALMAAHAAAMQAEKVKFDEASAAHAGKLADAKQDALTKLTETKVDYEGRIATLKKERDETLAAKEVELVAIKAELAERNALIESAKTAIKGAIANPALDDAATVSTIAQVVAVAEMPAIEKLKLKIAAEIAAKQAELDAL